MGENIHVVKERSGNYTVRPPEEESKCPKTTDGVRVVSIYAYI